MKAHTVILNECEESAVEYCITKKHYLKLKILERILRLRPQNDEVTVTLDAYANTLNFQIITA